jgi:hypothetical protein
VASFAAFVLFGMVFLEGPLPVILLEGFGFSSGDQLLMLLPLL